MIVHYGELGDTFYFPAAVNDTSGSGIDGSSAVCRVRLCGAAASAAAVHSPTANLLTSANYEEGAYEIEIQATAGNGYATNSIYSVYFTLAADSQNPNGVLGQIVLGRLQNAADLGIILETTVASVTSQASFTLTDGSTADDAYNVRMITIQDATDSRFIDVVQPDDYVGATKTLTLTETTSTFSVAVGDTVRVYKDFHPKLVLHPANVTHVLGTQQQGAGTEVDYYRPA